MNKASKGRHGFTILEVLVTIAIIGILVALLVPAVQHSRATSRRLQCQDHLRQIGVALASREASANEFPSGEDGYIELLPYLEQSAAYDIAKRPGYEPIPLITFLNCPSETYEIDARSEQVPNYRFNSGTHFSNQSGTGLNGFRLAKKKIIVDGTLLSVGTKTREITDGLSNTAALSERLVTRGARNILQAFPPEIMAAENKRFPWITENIFSGSGVENLVVSECQKRRISPSFNEGITPSVRSADIGYNHLLPPNRVSCLNGSDSNSRLHFEYAIIPPSSLHIGGVNVLFADGSVHFVAENIDISVWQSIGTRNGGESYGMGSF